MYGLNDSSSIYKCRCLQTDDADATKILQMAVLKVKVPGTGQ